MNIQSCLRMYRGYLWKAICTGALVSTLASGAEAADNCGYHIASGTYATWPGGYQAWVEIANQSGEIATDFEVLLDTGGTAVTDGALAEYEAVERGYSVTAPHWLQWQTIAAGANYRFQFNGAPDYAGVTSYLISINGEPCDEVLPQVTLAASARYFTAAGNLVLTASATDNTAVRKVVFARDGEVVAEDWEVPYELELAIDETANGRHRYTATAYDPSGNATVSAASRLLVSIGDKFFGTAPDVAADYQYLRDYFNQLTPGNSGKWGSVESSRDQMNWQNLDTAYQFARAHHLRFKQHTLIWGQQQPGWLGELPPGEQLEEIDEWMAALAERYPDLEMLDVVNEPLHAQPAYKEALGGDGETGWDWLINAFALARAHFPGAELILNDYNILILPQFTGDYLALIELLQSRGLIDGIGLQAHFLERAELDVVQANLDTLAATGLPIYISELELNFADDARQANTMRDLFSIFWEHPAVVGVTHWGYLEGNMWRENGYLLRADGIERPALQWLACYMSGGDCDHLVPEYVPSGWSGDEYGLPLEAELYDQGLGLIAAGSQVAYTDDGDWILFRDVAFQQGWDTLWINYSKGNGEAGSISLHLDNLESAPLLTVPLEATAGWGSFSTLELPWTQIAGTRDLYIRFNDAGGVANLDWLRIGKPQPVSDNNLVADGGFESDTLSGWQSWAGANLSLSTDRAYAGEKSLLASARDNTGQFAVYNLTGAVSPGTTYAVSAQVLHTGEATDTMRLAAKVQCSAETEPEGHNSFPWLHNNTSVAPGEWTQLSANLAVPDCELVDVAIFFEGTSAGVDVYIDEIKVLPPPDGNLIADGSFEGATLAAGWSAWWSGGASLAITGEQAAEGTQSLKVSNRAENSNPSYNLTGLLEDGATYSVSVQARHTGEETAQITLTAKLACSSGDSYVNLADNNAVEPATWTQLSGALEIPPDCGIGEARIYFENTPLTVETLYIDEAIVAEI